MERYEEGASEMHGQTWSDFKDWGDVDRGLELGKRFGSVEDGFSYRRTTLWMLHTPGGVALQTLSVSAVAVEHGHRESAY